MPIEKSTDFFHHEYHYQASQLGPPQFLTWCARVQETVPLSSLATTTKNVTLQEKGGCRLTQKFAKKGDRLSDTSP